MPNQETQVVQTEDGFVEVTKQVISETPITGKNLAINRIEAAMVAENGKVNEVLRDTIIDELELAGIDWSFS